MHELSEKGGDQKIQQFGQNLEAAEKRIAEIDTMIMKLFEQNALGKISDERFEKMSSAYENEQRELNQKRSDLKARTAFMCIRQRESGRNVNREWKLIIVFLRGLNVVLHDGNGRTGRLLLNYELLRNNLAPAVIPKEQRSDYFAMLEYNDNVVLAKFLKELSRQEQERINSMPRGEEV